MKRHLLWLATLGALPGCGSPDDSPRWWQLLQADSPCYRVDLTDGLDETRTDEVDDLFACINHHGHIEPFQPVLEGLHYDSRLADPAAIELARAVNGMWSVQVDPLALAGVAAGALAADERPLDEVVDLVLELTYGQRANRVRSGTVLLTDADELERGVLVPLAPVLQEASGALLEDPTDTVGWVGSWLASDATRRWIRTLDSWVRSDHPTVSGPVQGVVVHLGELLSATRSPQNDEWPHASGDSLRDLLHTFLIGPDPALGHLAEDAATLLRDPGLRASLQPSLVQLHADGHLEGVAPQVVWMTRVTRQGEPRSPGQDSALESFIRLLATSNQPMTCEVDLWLTTIEAYSTPNLAVLVLSTLADHDPGLVRDGLGVVEWLTSNTVSDWVLRQAVNSGVCSGLTVQQLDDLFAVSTLTRPEAYDLLVVFVRVLEILKHDTTSPHPQGHLPVLADLTQTLYTRPGAYPSLEELVRDVGEQQVLVDLVDLVPVLADPAAYGLDAGPTPAASLPEALDLLQWVLEVEPGVDRAGWERLLPVARPVLQHEHTWIAVEHATHLMVDDRTRTARVLELLPPILAIDPELALLDALAATLAHERISRPTLRLIETPQVTGRLLASTPDGDHEEVPLAFLSRLLVGDTLADLLALVDRLFGR